MAYQKQSINVSCYYCYQIIIIVGKSHHVIPLLTPLNDLHHNWDNIQILYSSPCWHIYPHSHLVSVSFFLLTKFKPFWPYFNFLKLSSSFFLSQDLCTYSTFLYSEANKQINKQSPTLISRTHKEKFGNLDYIIISITIRLKMK